MLVDGQLVPLPETEPRYPRPKTPVGAKQPEEDDQSKVQVDCKKVPVIPFKPVENINNETSMIAHLLQGYDNKNPSTLVAPSTTQTMMTSQTTTNDKNKHSITTANTVVCSTMQNNMNLSADYPTVELSALFNENSLNFDFASLGIQPRTAEQVCT